jgi:hypothetical protein
MSWSWRKVVQAHPVVTQENCVTRAAEDGSPGRRNTGVGITIQANRRFRERY